MKAIFVSFSSGKLIFLRVSNVISRTEKNVLEDIENYITEKLILALNAENNVGAIPILFLINQETIISIDDMVVYEKEEDIDLDCDSIGFISTGFVSFNNGGLHSDPAQEILLRAVVKDYILDIEVVEVDEIESSFRQYSNATNQLSSC